MGLEQHALLPSLFTSSAALLKEQKRLDSRYTPSSLIGLRRSTKTPQRSSHSIGPLRSPSTFHRTHPEHIHFTAVHCRCRRQTQHQRRSTSRHPTRLSTLTLPLSHCPQHDYARRGPRTHSKRRVPALAVQPESAFLRPSVRRRHSAHSGHGAACRTTASHTPTRRCPRTATSTSTSRSASYCAPPPHRTPFTSRTAPHSQSHSAPSTLESHSAAVAHHTKTSPQD